MTPSDDGPETPHRDSQTHSGLDISRELLLGIVEQADDMIFARKIDGEVLYCNPASDRILGYPPSELVGQSIWKTFPEDRQDEFRDLMERFRKGEAVEDFETVRRRKDGRDIPVSITLSPIRDKDGNVYAVAGILRDITSRKRTQELQKLVARELQHRVKNVLAVVRSLLTQTARQSDDLDIFLISFRGRLDALARVQGVMSRTVAAKADFQDMVSEELIAHGARIGENVMLEGPDVSLRLAAAGTVGLVLHELASNSAKFGALTTDEGSIHVAWDVDTKPKVPVLSVVWDEKGSADPKEPGPPGFGCHLIEHAVPYQLNGEVRLDIRADAVRCELTFPLSRERTELEMLGITQ